MAYHGPGRGPGNSISVLLNAHRLTGEAAFVEKAEELIRRCIHPADDIGARNLLDAERRWYYTVFLQALGEYLERKVELGERDRMYGYARASLLHYARWMAEHEYPYLDRPEILEYPNETWAAQDIRKCDVLNLASRHADGDERRRFLERADFFFRSSTTTLAGMPTRVLTRPVVLMLTHGHTHAWFQMNTAAVGLPPADRDYGFGEPARFVPQATRALRRGLILAGMAIAVALGAWIIW
jgi:G:T-mismatch repair DNA endonuclease (very short patch repair protein)